MLIRRVLKTLWGLLDWRRRWAFLGLIALLFVAGLLEMTGMVALFGYIAGLEPDPTTGARRGHLARLFNPFFGELGQLDYVLLGGSVVVGVLLTKNLLSSLVHFALNRFLMKLNQHVSKRLFEGYLLARLETFGARGINGPIAKINRTFDLFSSSFGATAQIIADAATLTMVALLLLIVDPMMTLGGVLIFGVAGTLLYIFTQSTLASMGRREKQARGEAGRFLQDGFNGLVDGRLNNTRGWFVQNYVGALSRQALVRRRTLLLSRLPVSINEVLLAVTIVSFVSYLTLRDVSVQEALPTLAIFAFAGLRLTGAMSRVSRSLQTIRRKIGEFEQFERDAAEVAPNLFLTRADEQPQDGYLNDEARDPKDDGHLRKALELRDVTFTYPGAAQPAVQNASVRIERGSFVSFCGPSGGGKSTLVLLLMGMLKPTKGEVLRDGRPVQNHIRAWHRQLGYVPQRLYLASGTVRENVAFGRAANEIDDEKVWRALELAAAADFVRSLPKGIHTKLKEAGSSLSGGQRQRIIIARALYKEPEVIFFDEATAALDNVTEREIAKSIQGLSGDKTVICVAHRLSTIRWSDVIYVVDGGRIVDSGTYDELLEKSPVFQELALESDEDDAPKSGRALSS